MKDFWKSVGKGLILFGIAAAAWAALTPLLAAGVAALFAMPVASGTTALALFEGASASATAHVLFTGLSFGMFGALYAGAERLSRSLFNEPAADAPPQEPHHRHGVLLKINNVQLQPDIAQENIVQFARKIEENRLQLPQEIER